jgi:fluoride exporter
VEVAVTWLLVVLGGMVGAPLRYLVDVRTTSWLGPGFPFGTLAANAAACVLLGAVAGLGLAADEPAYVLLGTGVAGAMSTYSTFAFETVRLAEEGRSGRAAAYAAVSPVVGLTALLLGLVVA